ncbi:MAG TPA: hypothetical protein VM260_28635 [Pirellula sp.]|nr:hypothetical protein [Pirellula sp.]
MKTATRTDMLDPRGGETIAVGLKDRSNRSDQTDSTDLHGIVAERFEQSMLPANRQSTLANVYAARNLRSPEAIPPC